MPRPEPVTIATRLSSLPMVVSFSVLLPGWPPIPPPSGWVRLDCHLQLAASGDARTTLDQLVQRIEAAHLDIVCVTDHHRIDFAELARILVRDIGARVVVGEEIRTPSGELIG